jgi:endonuclease YncB( thermonuclease family)
MLAPASALACIPPDPAAKVPARAVAVAVGDGQTLRLDTGASLRLAGILAPRAGEPFAAEAGAGLAQLAVGQSLVLHPGPQAFDRYGRILAQADLESSGLWLQGVLLDRGLARAMTLKDNRGCAAELLAREAAARAAGRGLWALPGYAVRRAERIGRADLGRFVIVEGTVRAVAVFSDRAYLNYGPDYRKDFTAEIAGPDLALFRAEGYDLKALAGQAVRVRGWLQMLNGPMIALTHPEQIEKLGAGPGTRRGGTP